MRTAYHQQDQHGVQLGEPHQVHRAPHVRRGPQRLPRQEGLRLPGRQEHHHRGQGRVERGEVRQQQQGHGGSVGADRRAGGLQQGTSTHDDGDNLLRSFA